MDILNQIKMADSKTLNSFEYAIESIPNSFTGETQTQEILKIIKKYTAEGWKVHTIYSNELGKNAVSFMGLGVNSTQSEDIIIFERHVQYNIICHTEKELLVTNYCSDLPVRFGTAKMLIPQNTNNFLFAIAGKYGSGVTMEAFRVDAEFITIFDEKIDIKNISFVTQNTGTGTFVTEPYEVQLNKNEIKLIKALKIYVKSYVSEGKAYAINDVEYIDVNEENLTIRQKDLFGQEYVQNYEENENGWTCICGKTNSIEVEKCPICGRMHENLKRGQKIDLAYIVETAETKNNAKEIYAWLEEYNKENCIETISILLSELESLVEIERLYGNQKSAALKTIKSCENEII